MITYIIVLVLLAAAFVFVYGHLYGSGDVE